MPQPLRPRLIGAVPAALFAAATLASYAMDPNRNEGLLFMALTLIAFAVTLSFARKPVILRTAGYTAVTFTALIGVLAIPSLMLLMGRPWPNGNPIEILTSSVYTPPILAVIGVTYTIAVFRTLTQLQPTPDLSPSPAEHTAPDSTVDITPRRSNALPVIAIITVIAALLPVALFAFLTFLYSETPKGGVENWAPLVIQALSFIVGVVVVTATPILLTISGILILIWWKKTPLRPIPSRITLAIGALLAATAPAIYLIAAIATR